MTPDNIDTEALRELEAKATPGPWTIVNVRGDTEVHAGSKSLSGDTQYYPWTFDIEDTRLIVALRNAAPALLAAFEAQRKEIDVLKADVSTWKKATHCENARADCLQAERDALKAEVEAERNEARGYREQFKTAVGHYTTLRARLGLDGFATVEEVLRKVDTLRSKLSASEAEVERLRAALESRDLMIETLQRALGPDKTMEAFGFDHERIANARRQLAEGKFITLDQLKDELKERAALRGEEAPRG